MINRIHHGVYGIIRDRDSIVLVHKSRGPFTGKLDLPGGRPEAGENSEQTLIREVQEETGIQVEHATYLTDYVYQFIYEDNGQKINFMHNAKIYQVDTFYTAGFDAAICCEDVKGAGWFTFDQLQPEQLSPLAAYLLFTFLPNEMIYKDHKVK